MRHFATSTPDYDKLAAQGRLPQRSPLSATDADAMETRLYAERTGPATPASARPTDPMDELVRLVAAALPGVKFNLGASANYDGIRLTTRLYTVELYGPEVGAALVRSQGHSPAAAVDGLKAKWARARREHDIATLLLELGRLRGEALTPDEREHTAALLRACRTVADYNHLAARCRSHARRQGQQAAA